MKEKSRWFYTRDTAHTKAVVLLAHGLNLHPKKMDALAQFFTESHCDVLRISLGPDHLHWEEKFKEDYEKAREHSEVLGLPLYFVGYSLGALTGLHFMMKHPVHQFKKMAVFAPAIQTKAFTKVSAYLSFLFPRGCLPSLNLREYRDRNFTTLAEYRRMYEMQKELQFYKSSIPALVFASTQDELIHYTNLEKFAGTQPSWKLVTISNHDSPLPKKYHHLMIDDRSLGQSEWEKILKNLTAYFDL